MNMSNASPLTVLALSKLVSKSDAKVAREGLGPGVHPVDVTVRVTGDLKIAEDPEDGRAPTVKVLTKATVALLVRRMGCTREKALSTLLEVFNEAMVMDEDAREKLLNDTGVNDALGKFKTDVIDKLPRLSVKGAVRSNLEAEVFGPAVTVDDSLVEDASTSNDTLTAS